MIKVIFLPPLSKSPPSYHWSKGWDYLPMCVSFILYSIGGQTFIGLFDTYSPYIEDSWVGEV